jgi:electron transport complex protein RnfG
MEADAPDGYGGDIKLLVAIRSDGEIAGVRVLADHETPGLGDYIEIAKSDWIKIFDGTSLARYAPRDWRVKKDGGKFDYETGATISPRAVVKAVHKALEYFRQHRAMLLGTAQTPAGRTGKAQGEQSP